MVCYMVQNQGASDEMGEEGDEMDKQTAIDLLDNLLGMVEDNHESDYDTAIKMGIDAIKALPSAQPERATGTWIDADLDKDFWTCSECKKRGCRDRMAWRPDYVKTHFRFCPNCGAQMERRDG